MADEVKWAGRSGEFTTVPTTDAPRPEANDSCPECHIGIADGSAWLPDPEADEFTRIHTGCLNKRAARRAAEQQQVAQTPAPVSSEDDHPPTQPIPHHAIASAAQNPLDTVRLHANSALSQAYSNPSVAIIHLHSALQVLITCLEHQENQ